MLSIVLKILSLFGILLLYLSGVAVLLVLLVLFFPVSYRLKGRKESEKKTVSARGSWLFGFLRIRFDYPEPGRILVKVLPFTVFDSGKKAGSKTKNDSLEQATDAARKANADASSEDSQAGKDDKGQNNAKQDCAPSENTAAGSESSDASDEGDAGNVSDSSILKKIKKIKYTIRGIYDKIKNIWKNISYYIGLLQEEETQRLFSHVIFRAGKILRNIRPRRIRGQVLFGTGSPDTTGYAYGVYGMLSPFLGNNLFVTPDFTRAVLEGDINISGHITVFTILWNVLKVLLDKKLRRFIKKIKPVQNQAK